MKRSLAELLNRCWGNMPLMQLRGKMGGRISLIVFIAGKHVVFGHVSNGMDVVKKVEGYGSSSGKTTKPIVIADCGQLK